MSRLSVTAFALLLAAQAQGRQAGTDRHGDPLPEGAVARLGTVRRRGLANSEIVAFSPDGKMIAAAGRDALGEISLWDAVTGRRLQRWSGSDRAIRSLAFSPDGLMLASKGATRNQVRLWDTSSGRELRQFRVEEDWDVFGDEDRLLFSPDGKTLACLVLVDRQLEQAGGRGVGTARGFDAVVHLFDVGTGKELRRIACPATVVSTFAFSPDGKVLATGHRDDDADGGEGEKVGVAVRLWDVATAKERAAWRATRRDVRSLAFTPDGKTLISGHGDSTVRLWNVAAGRQRRRLDAAAQPVPPGQDQHLGSGVYVALAGDGKTLVSACEDLTVKVWDIVAGRLLRRLPDDSPSSLALSQDGRLFLAGRLWDVGTGKREDKHEGHWSTVLSVAYSPDGNSLASASSEIRLWEPATGKQLRRLSGCAAVAFSPDGRTVACGGEDGSLQLYATATGKETRRFRVASFDGTHLTAVAFSPDGKLVAAGSSASAALGLWEVATGKLSPLVEKDEAGLGVGLNSITFSPDSQVVALSVNWGGVFLRRLLPQQASRQREVSGSKWVAFSPDGRLLAVAGRRFVLGFGGSPLSIHDVATGEHVRAFTADTMDPLGVAFSPDGRSVVSGDGDGTVRLWEVATGGERLAFKGHEGSVLSVAFSPDGKTVASGGEDTTTLVWDVAGAKIRYADSLTAERLDALWADLADKDAATAFAAVRRMAASPAHAVPFLESQLREAHRDATGRIPQLVDDLSNLARDTREDAAYELRRLGAWAEPALLRALQGKPSAEAHRVLVSVKDATHSPGTRRLIRAVEVLEAVGTADARRALGALAEVAPEAMVAAQRLARRAAP